MPSDAKLKIKANIEVETACLMWPGEEEEFMQDWIVVRQVDEKDGVTTGVFYHIRKRTADDPAGKSIIDSL
jgi:hypothetical protein